MALNARDSSGGSPLNPFGECQAKMVEDDQSGLTKSTLYKAMKKHSDISYIQLCMREGL